MLRLSSEKITQFLKFGIVGLLGLGWDTTAVYSLRPLIGLTTATIAAYFIAASINWLVNRLWTFRKVGNQHHFVIQWLRFLAGNSLGFFLNRGCVFMLFHTSPIFKANPVLALTAGAAAGMMANFHISRKLVFHGEAPDTAKHDGAEIVPFQPERAVAQNAVSSRTAVVNSRSKVG